MNNNKSSAKRRNLFQFNSVEIFTWFTSHFNRVRAEIVLYVFKLLHTTKQPTNLIASRSRHCWTLHAIAKILIHVLHMCMRWEKILFRISSHFSAHKRTNPFFSPHVSDEGLWADGNWPLVKPEILLFRPDHSSQPFSHTRRTSRSRSISSKEMVKAPAYRHIQSSFAQSIVRKLVPDATIWGLNILIIFLCNATLQLNAIFLTYPGNPRLGFSLVFHTHHTTLPPGVLHSSSSWDQRRRWRWIELMISIMFAILIVMGIS